MTTHRPGRPAGFTLIELLVVVAILAVLATIGIGAYMKVQDNQRGSNTELTLAKINSALNRLVGAVRDTADQEFKDGTFSSQTDELIKFCGGDRDRARSVWQYCRLKNEFPQNFLEARSAVVLRDSSNNNLVVVRTRKTFTSNTTIAAATTNPSTKDEGAAQAAALLYLIVTEKGTRGETYGDGATGATAGEVSAGESPATKSTFRVFTDGWGVPISYVRFATNTELQEKAYLKNTTNKDPLDPTGRLSATWPTAANRDLVASWLFFNKNTGGTFENRNWAITAFSAGSNKEYDTVTLTAPSTNGQFTVDAATDDMLGYRLAKSGQRSD
jgi:prepilin-type N-terminal cleavage/methylation domain-containing protein